MPPDLMASRGKPFWNTAEPSVLSKWVYHRCYPARASPAGSTSDPNTPERRHNHSPLWSLGLGWVAVVWQRLESSQCISTDSLPDRPSHRPVELTHNSPNTSKAQIPATLFTWHVSAIQKKKKSAAHTEAKENLKMDSRDQKQTQTW